jgi:hypothetical protein
MIGPDRVTIDRRPKKNEKKNVDFQKKSKKEGQIGSDRVNIGSDRVGSVS